MNILKLAVAAAIALSGLALPAGPAAAQDRGGTRWASSDAGSDGRYERRRYRSDRYRGYRHRGYRANRHRVCRWVWRYHQRRRVCTWRYHRPYRPYRRY
jgi:hypothetical protein